MREIESLLSLLSPKALFIKACIEQVLNVCVGTVCASKKIGIYQALLMQLIYIQTTRMPDIVNTSI